MRVQLGGDGVDGLGVDRLLSVELPTHTRVLAALSGEQERGRPAARRPGGEVLVRFALGGGGLLAGLDRYLSQQLEIPVWTSETALTNVVSGCLKVLETPTALKQILMRSK